MVRGCGRPAAPHRWLADVVARHGHQVGDGVFRLGYTQAELAADAGCSSGTIQARISLLEGQGLVLSRRPLTVRVPLGVTPTVTQPEPPPSRHHRPAPASTPGPGAPNEPAGPDPQQALPHLLAANAALAAALAACPSAEILNAQQAVIATLTSTSRIREAELADPRPEAAVPRPGGAVPRLSEGESVSQDLDFSKTNQTDSLTQPSARNRGSATRAESRIREERARADIDQLVGPLTAIADRCGLIGVTDRAGLHKALSPYTPDQIRHAVSQVTRMTKTGKIASPFGWLIAAAGRGDPDLFTTARPPARQPPPPHPPAPPDNSCGAEAEQALARASPDELARIDAHIRTAAHFAPVLHRILDQPDALHAARLEAWRTLQEAS